MIGTQRTPSVNAFGDGGDPLSAVLRPPATETDQERALRLEREAEAKRISDKIDEEINQDRKRKKNKDVKLLLLGQAESGKSTLQKQFQLLYNPTSLDEEALSWRTVVYYNIARPVRRILEALDIYGDGDDDEDDEVSRSLPESQRLGAASPTHSIPTPSLNSDESSIDILRAHLVPLLSVEHSLAQRLSDGVDVSGSGKGSVFVRTGWQSRSLALSFGSKKAPSRFSLSSQRRNSSETPPPSRERRESPETSRDPLTEEVSKILTDCKDDVRELWGHSAVRRLRDRRKLRLEEWAEYFLDNIARVSSDGYVPTLDDILHARIQTMGVAEHIFEVSLHGRNVAWHLYDVGGARGQRHSWIPYFDDANAIIFLAPVSAYDQYLEEDPRINRIDDSLQLFTEICANQLLKKVHLVLFLNKTDVLQNKIDRGISVKKYITSFGDRPMDFETVVNYFKTHFTQVHKRNNENKRVLYSHLTSVVDCKATRNIITNVSDSIFRKYLADAALV